MATPKLMQFAHDLEWLGAELEYYGQRHALAGFPESGPTWVEFLTKQRGVLLTVDKVERELKNLIRYNPTALVGVEFPLATAFESLSTLLAAAEDIRSTALNAVPELPQKVRHFARMVETYLETLGGSAE
jgi:hypothetical protein